MAFTNEQAKKLEDAIASGVLSVRYADRTITYQSLEEMRKLLKQMRDELAAASGKPRRRRIVRLYQSGMGNV